MDDGQARKGGGEGGKGKRERETPTLHMKIGLNQIRTAMLSTEKQAT